MEPTIPLIFIFSFVFASIALLVVYKYGIKEKDYEEVIAEQRQQRNALLGPKPKPKEKKKKAAKKPKEKQSSFETDTADETDKPEEKDHRDHKPHVEFKEQPEEVLFKEPTDLKVAQKRSKKEKVKPILVNRDEHPDIASKEVPTVNHFVEIHPKDDVELLRANSKDDLLKQDTKEKQGKKGGEGEKVVKKVKQKVEAVVVEAAPVVEKPVKEEKVKEKVVVVESSLVNGVAANVGKDKKKKKGELNVLQQQLHSEREGLFNLVRKAELSRSEVQTLIDLLLNKQHEAPAVIDDWTEGKSDPVQKLKKQLAEKEKLLVEGQEALLGAQSKLKEVREEQKADKIQLTNKCKALEIELQSKVQEVQNVAKQSQAANAKISELQAQLQQESIRSRQLHEELAKFQMQMQHFESNLAQEKDMIIAQLREELQEVSGRNQILIVEANRKIEELNMVNSLLQEKSIKLETAAIAEADWKKEVTVLKNTLGAMKQQVDEKVKIEMQNAQLQEKLQSLSNEYNKTIGQLKMDLQAVKEQKDLLEVKQLNGSNEKNKEQEVQVLNLTNELSSIKKELTSASLVIKDLKDKLETTNSKCQSLEKELQEQRAKNNELRTKNWKVVEALNAAESRLKSCTPKRASDNLDEEKEKTLSAQKEFLIRLFPQLEELKGLQGNGWQQNSEEIVKKHLAKLEKLSKPVQSAPSPDVGKLQAKIKHYEQIINDTEGMLNMLQARVEQEEVDWRHRLADKDAQLEQIKKQHASELQLRVSALESDLNTKRKENQQLSAEIQKLRSTSNSDSAQVIEKLNEEVNRLSQHLKSQQNGDCNINSKAQNFNSTNGGVNLEASSSSSRSPSPTVTDVTNNTNNKSKSKKKKKKKDNKASTEAEQEVFG